MDGCNKLTKYELGAIGFNDVIRVQRIARIQEELNSERLTVRNLESYRQPNGGCPIQLWEGIKSAHARVAKLEKQINELGVS
jgi:hypothetical protein